MKEYLLVAKGSRAIWDEMSEEDWKPVMDGFGAWIGEMSRKNLWIRGDRLSPKRTDIRKNSGNQVAITDGPFTETKEALSGYFVFRAENMGHAVELAKGCPALLHDKLELYEMEGDRE